MATANISVKLRYGNRFMLPYMIQLYKIGFLWLLYFAPWLIIERIYIGKKRVATVRIWNLWIVKFKLRKHG